MKAINELREMAQRIDDKQRREGDPDCVFFGGHWHGKPVAGGTVGVWNPYFNDNIPHILKTEEFVSADGRILWPVDADGNVTPPGTVPPVAEVKEEGVADEVQSQPAGGDSGDSTGSESDASGDQGATPAAS